MAKPRIRFKQLPTRQRVRKALLFVSLMLLPVTLYYFSPILILAGASEGVITGSFLVFALQFVSALVVGRAWCGWVCPAGALQEFAAPINDARMPRRRADWIKWAIWLPWVGLIAGLALAAGGLRRVDPFFQLPGGVTLAIPTDEGGPPWYVIYYLIVALFVGLAVVFGRRAGCHTICWMAPFMILGRKLRNRVGWPALQLEAGAGRCTDCMKCTLDCPMSLDVNAMVRAGDMEDAECILCATCADTCPHDVIHMTFGGRKLAPARVTEPAEAVAASGGVRAS
ncbi:MAG: 4Fe-4S binding protein [Anaerolineales bacterium]|nr:4Fe-4S binding protein [Anaerolineales bacterium]